MPSWRREDVTAIVSASMETVTVVCEGLSRVNFAEMNGADAQRKRNVKQYMIAGYKPDARKTVPVNAARDGS